MVADNTIDRFAGDGIDHSATNIIMQGNHITNGLDICGSKCIHNDAIQGWNWDDKLGITNKNVVIDSNYIESQTVTNLPLATTQLEGISIFDGFWQNVSITNNVVLTSGLGGITIAGVSGLHIVNNTVMDIPLNGVSQSRIYWIFPGATWITAGGTTHEGGTTSNVIVRNLNVQGVWPNSGADDTLHSQGSHHIWYDHLNIWDATDGEMDITIASNYHTVSWCKFSYTSASNGHRLCSLNGSGGGDHPEDSGHEKATYHHNWWSTLVNERMPRMMYGQLHAFNNYYSATGNSYCIGVGSFGSAVIENNYFKGVNNPHQFMYDLHAYIAATGNTYDNTTGLKDTGLGGTAGPSGVNAGVEDAGPFTPPYSYTMDKVADVPAIVQKCAGPH